MENSATKRHLSNIDNNIGIRKKLKPIIENDMHLLINGKISWAVQKFIYMYKTFKRK